MLEPRSYFQGYTYSVFNLVYETNVASCRIWDALGFKRIGRVKGCGNLKSYPNELVDAIIYGRDLAQDDEFVSEERFDKIRFYLKNGKYPNGADRAEKSRLRSAATHYKLTPADDNTPEKLWLKGKEVIPDPQQQYEIAREVHHKSHGGINKTTAAIAELYHWVRIKETVSQVIRNCPECSEMNKGLSAMRQNQNRTAHLQQSSNANTNAAAAVQSASSSVPPTPPTQKLTPPTQNLSDSALHLDDSTRHNQTHNHNQAHTPNLFTPYTTTSSNTHSHSHAHVNTDFDLPVDPALMEDIQSDLSLADLPPSPFLNTTASGTSGSGGGLSSLSHLDLRMGQQGRMQGQQQGRTQGQVQGQRQSQSRSPMSVDSSGGLGGSGEGRGR